MNTGESKQVLIITYKREMAICCLEMLVSAKNLLNSTIRYNTFILGSSRTTSVYACYVQRKVNDSRAFHYGNWNESIGGILEKVKLLDSLGYNLRNVIIYIDTDVTFDDDGSAKPYDHYLIAHISKMRSRIDHFQSFISDVQNLSILTGRNPPKDEFPNWHSDQQLSTITLL